MSRDSITTVLLIAAGALFPLSLAPLYWWPVGLASLAVFALAIWQPASPLQAFKRSWAYAFGQFLAGVSWVYVSMHDYGGTSAPLAIVMVMLFAAGLALVPALVFSLYSRFRDSHGQQVVPWLLIPVFWFVSEWTRSWLLTGFPWLFVGDGHLFSWLSGWAPVIGSYGLSFIILLTITCLIQAARRLQPVWLSVLLLWPVGLWLQQHDWTQPGDVITVAAVQGNIDQNQKWQAHMVAPTIELYTRETRKLWQSDLVLWPETAVTLVYDRFCRISTISIVKPASTRPPSSPVLPIVIHRTARRRASITTV